MTTGQEKQTAARKFTPADIRAIGLSLQEAVDNLEAAAVLLELHQIPAAYLDLANVQNAVALSAVRSARQAKADVDLVVKARLAGTSSPREQSVLRDQTDKAVQATDKPK
ncbi:MAG: hypothetical protein V4719_07830 [Planctomycetota bacterium]